MVMGRACGMTVGHLLSQGHRDGVRVQGCRLQVRCYLSKARPSVTYVATPFQVMANVDQDDA